MSAQPMGALKGSGLVAGNGRAPGRLIRFDSRALAQGKRRMRNDIVLPCQRQFNTDNAPGITRSQASLLSGGFASRGGKLSRPA